ncbi:CBS-domain-containing membrane protein [Rhizobium rosettiformans]|uniref:CBS-domain-containing membrane protein n=2 Tax=Rhizobium rosettiformans TaxID=1368430 RepID=A0A7W8HUI5_9HYPH|nr:CBS-domain-containing membrane protein [Rhizobium rosettiformans]
MTFMRRFRSKHRKSVIDRFPGFAPILTGATLRERLIGCLGALIGISLTGFICNLAIGGDPQLPLIVAPMGASAVLLFAVPASPRKHSAKAAVSVLLPRSAFPFRSQCLDVFA